MPSTAQRSRRLAGARPSGPALPESRGALSDALAAALRRDPGTPVPGDARIARAEPYGDDLQLALHLCYELHYRGFSGVDADWEWDPELLRLRGALERRFLDALRDDVPGPTSLDDALESILVEPTTDTGTSHFLQKQGELWHLREYAAHRSVYHLKEADPHAWVIPRLWGRAKAAMVGVEFDEFGGGRPDRIHARLFADLMADLGLDTTYGRYVDAASAEMLAVTNMMSLFGLHRSLRGALVGHFAAVEITSPPASRRLAEAMRRAGPAAEHFYAEHVEADAVHEQLVRRDVIGGLLEEEPWLEDDVAFGIEATGWLEDRFGDRVLEAWSQGRTSLNRPPL